MYGWLAAFMADSESIVRSLDYTAITVAFLGLLGAIGAAAVQYRAKVQERNKREVAETVAQRAGVSETAMANVAEKSLELLQSLLDSERKENEALQELWNSSQRTIIENHEIIAGLKQRIVEKDNKIAELERELSRLRGRMDQVLNREDSTYG